MLCGLVFCACTTPTAQPEETAEVVVDRVPLEPALPEAGATEPPRAVERSDIDLVSPGTEPRRILRWTLDPGTKGSLTLVIDVGVEMSLDGTAQPNDPTPTVAITLGLEVEERTPEGNARVGFVVTQSAVSKEDRLAPESVAQNNRRLATLVGLEGSYVCSSQGIVSDVQIDASRTLPPSVGQTVENLRQALQQMIAPFPKEAIGKGGKWSVRTSYEEGGMQITEVSSFTIVSLAYPVVEVRLKVTQSAPPQTVTGSNGQSGKLESLSTHSTGSARWNLTQVAPTSVDKRSKMRMAMRAPGPDGKTHQMSLSIDYIVRMTGGP